MEASEGLHVLLPRAAQGAGSNRNSQGSSLSALVSTLIPTLLIALAIFIAFLIFRKKLQRVYQPRSYIDSLRNWQRSPSQTAGLLGWRKEFQQLTDEFVLGHASIDNFLWLRYLKMLTMMCFVGCLITWPILFPVNATGGASGSGLDILSFSHINPGPRYFAQVFVAWVFLGWVIFMISRESIFFVRLQQLYFLTPYQKARISSRTVLFVNVPEAARNAEHLRREYAGVQHVWLVSVPQDLQDKVEERDKAAAKLETGEVKLIQNYIKRQIKAEKKGPTQTRTTNADGTPGPVNVDKKDVPSHRLPILKFIPLGKKVNTIEWSRSELHRLIPEVASEQHEKRHDSSNVQGAVFIEFETVEAATAALNSGGLKGKAKMTPKESGMTPDNVIWKNIVKPFAKVKLFDILCTAFVWFLCIFWTIPVAVIGAISNINALTNKVHFLSFIEDIPPVILGLVTGLLPVVLLAILMALVPIVMNIMAKQFEPTQGSVQMKVQGWYFPFQVIQVFLVTTFASGAASVVTDIISNPQQAPTLLAQNLPLASNFYISYFILQGLMIAALQFLNIAPLLFVLFLGKILDKTPRKMYNRYINLGGLGWGALYPKFANLGVIALAYSCIAPLILGFATIGFALMYLGYRYNALFTIGTNVSTRGESYARGLQQLMTGVYLSEICLIGLFAIGTAKSTISVGPLVLMIIFLVGTIVWHVFLNRILKKLRASLPEEESSRLHQAFGTNGHDVEKAPGHDGHSVESQRELHPDGAMAKPLATNAPNAQRGFMGRIKGYFSPKAAASSAVWSVGPNLSVPARPYTQQEHDEAYIHPAIVSECPTVWIARDKYGLSQQEVMGTRRAVGEGLEISDEYAWFNEKGKIEWSEQEMEKVPIYEDEPAY